MNEIDGDQKHAGHVDVLTPSEIEKWLKDGIEKALLIT